MLPTRPPDPEPTDRDEASAGGDPGGGVDDRTRAARAARAAALAEQGFDATCVWTASGGAPGEVVEWPPSAERLYALPAADALGRPRHAPTRTHPVGGSWADVMRALREAGRWEGELAHQPAGAAPVLTDTRLLLVPPAAAGDDALVVEIARDVTARRAAEAALAASENRLAAIIASALDAIVTVDEAYRVVLFNAAAERLFGVPASAALGAPLDRFIPSRFRASHRASVAAFGAAGVAARSMSPARAPAGVDGVAERAARPGTVVGLRGDGAEFPIEAAISKVETPAGRLYSVIVRDVSERVRTEAERERLVRALEEERARLAETARSAEAARAEADAARREAETASRAKSAFLATMSHELRTPLNAVLGYAELLDLGLAGPVTDAQRGYLDRIAASGRHLLGLMDDVLDLSKIEAGRMTVARRAAGAAAAARAAVALVRPTAAHRAIELTDGDCRPAPGDDDDGPAYLGDEDRVRQILVNLLSNAVKFTEPGGRVAVTCAARDAGPDGRAGTGRWVALRVVDTGIGIPREHLELVFARFEQVDRELAGPYRRTQGGTGLGLAISRELAHLMGGDLTVESEPGRGSAFTLWLPAAPGVDEADGAGGQAQGGRRAADGGGHTVGPLLADSARRVIASWLDRLRGDPLVPNAARVSRSELEDHTASFLADFAQQFVILDDPAAPGAARVVLVRDGVDVRRLLSRRHGAQRAGLGWDEPALAREFVVLAEELDAVLAARLSDVPVGAADDARALVRALLAEAACESAAGLREARAAALAEAVGGAG